MLYPSKSEHSLTHSWDLLWNSSRSHERKAEDLKISLSLFSIKSYWCLREITEISLWFLPCKPKHIPSCSGTAHWSCWIWAPWLCDWLLVCVTHTRSHADPTEVVEGSGLSVWWASPPLPGSGSPQSGPVEDSPKEVRGEQVIKTNTCTRIKS